jgi:NADH dehydrogenase
MNVLVTGGTGFVGRHVLRELHRAGHEIFFLSRRGHSAACYAIEEEFSGNIRSGDILDPKSLPEAVAGIDAMIHLVGIISEVGGQTFENVHTRGTENLIRAAQQAGVKRFIHMSALGTRPNAVARYHQSKWKAEETVRQSGLDWTIFRPSIIYGPGDGFVNLFAKMIRRSPIVPIIGSGESKLQPIAVENVAKAFVGALKEARSVGQTYALAGPEVFTLNQIVDHISASLNRKRLKLHIPLPLARIQASLLEFLFGKLLRKAPPLNRDQVLMLQEDNVGDGKPADALFSLQHGTFREGIERYVNV